MTTHVPADATARLVLDGEAIAKALSRIAHEVIERTDDLQDVALVGIQSRGAPLASRLRRLVEERSGVSLPVGALDITFHRDDVHVRDGGRAPDRQPVVRATSISFPIEGMTVVPRDFDLVTIPFPERGEPELVRSGARTGETPADAAGTLAEPIL